MKKILILILFFYLLTLFQSSFLIHFNILGWEGWSPNLILIAIILLNFFEDSQKNLGIFSAICGGFFLDIFSENFIGFYILISVGLAIFVKYILKKHVRIPIIKPR